jgi:hypothetical protein
MAASANTGTMVVFMSFSLDQEDIVQEPPDNQQLFFGCQYASSAGDHDMDMVHRRLAPPSPAGSDG